MARQGICIINHHLYSFRDYKNEEKTVRNIILAAFVDEGGRKTRGRRHRKEDFPLIPTVRDSVSSATHHLLYT